MRPSKIKLAIQLLAERDAEDEYLLETANLHANWHDHDCLERVVMYFFRTMTHEEVQEVARQYEKSGQKEEVPF